MEKNFFEAFPNLKLTGARKDLFEQVVVERITATRRKDILRIYIRSERLIEKEDVYGVEQEIKKQFSPKITLSLKSMRSSFCPVSTILKNLWIHIRTVY